MPYICCFKIVGSCGDIDFKTVLGAYIEVGSKSAYHQRITHNMVGKLFCIGLELTVDIFKKFLGHSMFWKDLRRAKTTAEMCIY